MNILKSKIKAKKAIPWGQVILINELVVNPIVLSQMEKGVKENNPKIKQEELQQQVYKMVLRDNYFNRIMDIVSKSYQFEFDEAELKQKQTELKAVRSDMEDSLVAEVVRLNVIRDLIFVDLAKQFQVNVTDEQTKESLDKYYEQTGQPIREFLSNRQKFDEIKRTIFDQIISERLMNAFKPDFQLDEFNKRLQAEQEKKAQPEVKPTEPDAVKKTN